MTAQLEEAVVDTDALRGLLEQLGEDADQRLLQAGDLALRVGLLLPEGSLQLVIDAGLGYLKLGQPLNTLSGGEAQRLKLVGHLLEPQTPGKSSLLLLDEPTTGLHFDDIKQLLDVLNRLVEQGNTVIVIEHNLDVIKTADYIVDMGPEGGDGGGSVVACGTPEDIARVPTSYTGQYLRKVLAEG